MSHRITSAKVARKASKVLKNPRSSKIEKSVAASALAQRAKNDRRRRKA